VPSFFKYAVVHAQDYSVLSGNAVIPVAYKGWYFAHVWRALAGSHHFTKRGGLGPYIYLNPATFLL